jgi:hypothetical protein
MPVVDTPPASPVAGDTWTDASGRRFVWTVGSTGAAWVQLAASPPQQAEGTVWTDPSGRRFIWTVNSLGSGVWVQTPPLGMAPYLPPVTAAVPYGIITTKIPVVTAATAPPGDAQPNDLWYDSATGFFFIYYDDGNTVQWVVTNPGKGGNVGPPGQLDHRARPVRQVLPVRYRGHRGHRVTQD